MKIWTKRIKYLREKQKLTQQEVADKIGMSVSGLRKIEYGERDPSLESLIYLTKLYKVSTDFILGVTDLTKDLEQIKSKMMGLKNRINQQEEMLSMLKDDMLSSIKKVDDLKSHIAEIDKIEYIEKNDYSEERSMYEEKLKVMEIHRGEMYSRIHHHESSLEEYKQTFNELLTTYIIKFYYIPDSNPEEDVIIKEYLPLKLFVDEFGSNGFKLSLKSLEKGYIGKLAINQKPDAPSIALTEIQDQLEEYAKLFRIDTELNTK